MQTVQACPACRTGMVARRGDPLCLTCMKAAREMPERPTWLFDSPLLRQALAALNLSAVPAIVRAASGLSQRDLAVMAGWSQAALSYYERGVRDGMYDIRTALQFADAVGMPRAALLPLVFADADVGLAVDARAGAGVEPGRRGFGGQAFVPGLPAVLLPVSAPRAVTGSHVRYWQASADTLYARDRSVGGTVLLPLAVQQWRRARLATREHGDGEAGRELFSASGELALCTGWLAVDGGQLPLVKLLHGEASDLAARSGDAMLAVHVLISQSMLCGELARSGPGRGPARQALRLAFQAQEEGRYIPEPRLHVLIALRHAGAASLLGDRVAFEQAIAQARRELDRGPGDGDTSGWLRFADRTGITGAEADGWLHLGDPGRSVALYREVLASAPGPRDRAGYGAGLAGALLEQGARQDAVAAAADVLPALENEVTSMRVLGRLRLVRQAAGGMAVAAEFCERFDAVERTLTAVRALSGSGIPDSRAGIPA